MKISLNRENFNLALEKLKKEYKIYAPIEIPFRGTFSDTSVIRYSEIEKIDEICFDKKSHFSAKEIMLPITQTMFYFTEEGCKMPKEQEQKYLIFLRSCDLHGVKRVDDIYLNNKFLDIYYKRVRDKVKFVVFGCPNSFENCFCVDMGTNKTDEYNIGIKVTEEKIFVDIKDDELKVYFDELIAEKLDFLSKHISSIFSISEYLITEVSENVPRKGISIGAYILYSFFNFSSTKSKFSRFKLIFIFPPKFYFLSSFILNPKIILFILFQLLYLSFFAK